VWSVTAVPECTGSVTVVFVRGKARPGFEISLRVSWRLAGADGSEVASGAIACDDVSDAEGASVWGRKPAVTVTSAGAAAGGVTTAAAWRGAVEASALPVLRAALLRWAEALPTL
jgi:hypothetical protein